LSDEAIWVRTDPTPDGVYRVTMTWGDDRALVLDREAAAAHAGEVLAAVAEAEYDAAVVRQLTTLTGDQENALMVVRGLRKDRASAAPTTGLGLVPGVSAFTRRAYLKILMDGKPIGQWDPADARQHATFVLEAVRVAELDSAYLRMLRGVVGLDDQTARGTVGGLGQYRDES
jgi:hypothetical protein